MYYVAKLNNNRIESEVCLMKCQVLTLVEILVVIAVIARPAWSSAFSGGTEDIEWMANQQ